MRVYVVFLTQYASIYSCKVSADQTPVDVLLISQNKALKINRASPINISPKDAVFKIVHHFLYFPSSHAAITIKNHPYKTKISAIKAKIHNTRFTTLLTISNIFSFWSSCTHHIFKSSLALIFSCSIPNQKSPSAKVVIWRNHATHTNTNNIYHQNLIIHWPW